jgi:hypothetical protein
MADKPVFTINEMLEAGEKYLYHWNVSHVANGVYLARIEVRYKNGGKDKKTVKIAVLQ